MSRAISHPRVFDIFTAASNTSISVVRVPFSQSQSPTLASDQQRLDAIDQLLELSPRYRQQNWGGQNESPISERAIEEARKFLKKLPATVPLPEVVTEPDGYLGLEWFSHRWLLYVVSFNGSGAMSCSGLFGSERKFGKRYMDEGIPAEVLSNIAQILQ
jgi:hypothetical protein